MKELLYVYLIFGFGYIGFETLFNCIEEFIGYKKPLKEKIKSLVRLKPDNAPSLWMFFVSGIAGVLIHLWLMLPINNSNIFILLLTCLVGSVIITGLELMSGYVLNVKLLMNLWSYTSKIKLFGKVIKLNYMSQICVYRSIAWFFLTIPIIFINKVLF